MHASRPVTSLQLPTAHSPLTPTARCLHPCSDPVVPLVERAVHPLFLAAVSQIEVEMEGRGRVKLGDLYTHEVSQTLDTQLTANDYSSGTKKLALA